MKRDAHLPIPTSIDTSPVRPLWMRRTRQFNALIVMVLMLSGWCICNAAPFFPFTIPASATLGGWLGGALQWHFAAVWLLAVSGLVYLVMNVASSRLARKFFPITPADARCDMVATLKGRFSHANSCRYNNVQRLAYLLVTLDIMLSVFSGLVLWKSVQFAALRELLGDYRVARRTHFCAMAGAVALVVVHLVVVTLVPRTLLTMLGGYVTGTPSPIQGRSSHDAWFVL